MWTNGGVTGVTTGAMTDKWWCYCVYELVLQVLPLVLRQASGGGDNGSSERTQTHTDTHTVWQRQECPPRGISVSVNTGCCSLILLSSCCTYTLSPLASEGCLLTFVQLRLCLGVNTPCYHSITMTLTHTVTCSPLLHNIIPHSYMYTCIQCPRATVII